jgi:crotonobetainyl-CoA:carnitine CoA-transferase CaiB-like acyl-CoA transferase
MAAEGPIRQNEVETATEGDDVTALDGLRVVDFSTGLAGAITAMVLCDNGAHVIKVEPPGGDPDRALPAFAQWRRGQESVVADLGTPAGRGRAVDLASHADVIIESWLPGAAERLGLSYEDVAAVNPSVILCSITGFGPRGPMAGVKGYDAIVGATAGVMAYKDRPRFASIPGGTFAAAQGALQGILAALYVRGNTGQGQKVEASAVQGLTAYDLYDWLGVQLPPDDTSPQSVWSAATPQALGGTGFTPVSGMVGFTRDGRWLQFANFRPHLVEAFLNATELTESYREAVEKKELASVNEMALRRLHEKTLDEWMDIFLKSDDIGIEPFRTPSEALDHPQAIHNGNVIDVVDSALGKTRQVGPLVRLSETPAEPAQGAPPLGAHTESARFGLDRETMGNDPLPTEGPLAGVTVVELAWFYAAPFGTALLADLGARVIKIEGPDGDPHRSQRGRKEYTGVKALGGKQSIVVDYRTPEGKEILHKIIERADLVMRNYRQQNSTQTGDDYDSLRPVNPNQVYLYAGAYGADGPYTKRPAFAPTMGVAAGHRAYQLGWERALSRVQEITFDQGMEQMTYVQAMSGGPTNNADAAAALCVGTALLLGLVARQRAGKGQYLETSMLCSNAYVVSEDFFDFEGKVPASHHDENGVGPLYRLYETAEGWVFLAAPLDSEWEQLCAGLLATSGADLRSDPRFASGSERERNSDELATALAAVFQKRTAAEWEALLLAQSVACVEVSQTSLSNFTMSSPLVTENGWLAEADHPIFGHHKRHGPIMTLSKTPGVVGPSSLIGEHTRLILGELGYSPAQMRDLRDRGIVTWPDD